VRRRSGGDAAAPPPPLALAQRRAATSRNRSARIIRDGAGAWCVITEQPDGGRTRGWSLSIDAADGGRPRRVTHYPERWMFAGEVELRLVIEGA
jgi:hypothetical protein